MQEKATVRDEVELAAPAQDEQQRPRAATRERYAAGPAPALTTADRGETPPRTASQLAFEDDANARELKEKVSAMVTKRFGGDYRRAFEHYDQDRDGGVDKASLTRLLADAGVGNGITRGAWANGVLAKLDRSGDEKIQWSEFEQVIKEAEPVTPVASAADAATPATETRPV